MRNRQEYSRRVNFVNYVNFISCFLGSFALRGRNAMQITLKKPQFGFTKFTKFTHDQRGGSGGRKTPQKQGFCELCELMCIWMCILAHFALRVAECELQKMASSHKFTLLTNKEVL
jgi:hypothetical protein